MRKTRNIRGKAHVLCVAVVEELDSQGRPLRLRLIGEDERANLERENVFVTMFIPEESMRGGN
jgi:hypothetical protein